MKLSMIFPRLGRNMDGDRLFTWLGKRWIENRFKKAWQATGNGWKK
jgi:hypothetical protein